MGMNDLRRFVAQVTGLREENEDLRESVEQQARAMVALRARATLLCHSLKLAAGRLEDPAVRSAIQAGLEEARAIQYTVGSPQEAAELAAAVRRNVERLEALAKSIGLAPGTLQGDAQSGL